jgi:hypothetical protein
MSISKKTTAAYIDLKVNTKVKLSAMWIALMFFYLYRDVLGFMEPGHIEDLLSGELGGVQMTSTILLGSAILMAVPSLMVLFSLILKANLNRWLNIVLGILHLILLGSTLFVGEISSMYIFYVIVEAVLIISIVWSALKWPKQET